MIARTWHGHADEDRADAYVDHLRRSVVPALSTIDGYRGIFLLRRETDDGVEFGVLTLWDSMDAIRRFAGETPEIAVVAPDAKAVLTRFDAHVKHYEVAMRGGPGFT